MVKEPFLWTEWRERARNGASVNDLLASYGTEDLVRLLSVPQGGDDDERAHIRDALIAHLRDDAFSVSSHADVVQGITTRNRESMRAARADVTSARSSTRENVRILDNRRGEKNAGARLRHNLENADDQLERAQGHLDETDAADDEIARASREFADRGSRRVGERKPEPRD